MAKRKTLINRTMHVDAFRSWLKYHSYHPGYEELRNELKGATTPFDIMHKLRQITEVGLETGNETELYRFAVWAQSAFNLEKLYRLLPERAYIKVARFHSRQDVNGNPTHWYKVYTVDHDADGARVEDISEEVAYLLNVSYDRARRTAKTGDYAHTSEHDFYIAINRALWGKDADNSTLRLY